MAYGIRTEFEKGGILTAIVHVDAMVCHAYRLENSDRDIWYAPTSAEAAVRLAYGKGRIGGRYKTAREVWEEMLPHLERIPSPG
ncbi:MAG TPA: hypothetical protein VK658_09675 [Chryseolinea sp.]|nr:hypothetical protein [Chryseolinea sp.]